MKALMEACADMRNGTCKWCSEKILVFRDNSLCEDCDSRTVYCKVCRQRQGESGHCRHVFYASDYGWTGAGVFDSDPDMRLPVLRLLSAMGEDFARELREAIKRRQFYTWIVAPMIGGGGVLDLGGMDHQWGDRMISIGEGDRANKFSDGFHWLQSLYKGDTAKANQTTVDWINEWLWPFNDHKIKNDKRNSPW